MRRHRLNDMTRGWFVGDFEPAVLATREAEVGIKHFAAGEREPRHVHRISTELTAVVSGSVRMDGHELGAGDIMEIEPGEPCDFEALTDAALVVVKVPAAPDDKYLVQESPC